MNKILIRKDYEGEWAQLICNGQLIHAGHEIPDFVYQELLARLNCASEVVQEEVHFSVYGEEGFDCHKYTEHPLPATNLDDDEVR